VSDVAQVLGDKELVVDSEDEVLGFCREYFGVSGDASVFAHVHFGRVSVDALGPFVAEIGMDVVCTIWPSLKERLLMPLNEFSSQFLSSRSHGRNRRMDRFQSLLKFAGNRTLTLTATSSSCGGSNFGPENVLSENEELFYSTSDGKSDEWLCISFERKFVIESYTIMPRTDGALSPLSWIVEVSEDGNNYQKVDEQELFCTRENPYAWFKLRTAVECISVRITQKGKNSSNSRYFVLRKVDFSGFLMF
jgi:hypothetical protein